MPGTHRPPFELTPAVLAAVAEIMRLVGRYEGSGAQAPQPKLRRENRIRTVRASVAIEGNTLAEEQVSAVLDGRRAVGPAREVREVRNAIAAYALAPALDPGREEHLLRAHRVLMTGLTPDAGRYRRKGVGVLQGSRVAHVAPPAARVPGLVEDLLRWAKTDRETHPAIKAAVLHYELEFIHPFSDGNGRAGRLWQHVALVRFHPAFEHVPVESVIHARQADYYRTLALSDRAGSATPFLEFALAASRDALAELVGALRPERATPESRLESARQAFVHRDFSRKEYMALHTGISTATASRDLALGVERRMLSKRGTKAVARYGFR
jgi:Fic family protein